jgi:hypothetical protein
MFTDKELMLQFNTGWDSPPDIKFKFDGEEVAPDLFGGSFVGVRGLSPTDRFELILDGKSYPVVLTGADSVTDGGDIVEAEANSITWVSMGYKKIEGGVQILTTFDDAELHLQSLVIPESDRITEAFSGTSGGSQKEPFMPLVGYDAEGNAYEYQYDPNDLGRPLTKFISDAPEDRQITLKVPGIAVAYQKDFDNFDVALPAVGEKQDVNREIDLTLQKMVLESVERISATTARLNFKLNTGGDDSVKIWSAGIGGENLDSGELLWENGTCTADLTFAENETEINLNIGWPSFIVNGDWEMLIN